MFKKLFVPIASVIAVTSSFAFVSCGEDKSKNIKNIFTKVNYQQNLESKKSIIKTVVETFVSNASKKYDHDLDAEDIKNDDEWLVGLGLGLEINDLKESKSNLKYIKNYINGFIDPLAKILTIIDKQSKEFLDFFYNIEETNKAGIRNYYKPKQRYSKETFYGKELLVKELNKVMGINNKFMEKMPPHNYLDIRPNVWIDDFLNANIDPKNTDNYEESFFEKIGNKILQNKIAIDFWNKFINNRFHEMLKI